MKLSRCLFVALSFLLVLPVISWSDPAWSQPTWIYKEYRTIHSVSSEPAVQPDMVLHQRLSDSKARQPSYRPDHDLPTWHKKLQKHWQAGAVRVKVTGSANSPYQLSARLSASNELTGITLLPDGLIMVNTLSTYYLSSPYGPSPYGHQRIRVTLPQQYFLSSWDVRALERELERLGIKIKPKPAPPKPTVTLSG